jgi:hypothetical protein
MSLHQLQEMKRSQPAKFSLLIENAARQRCESLKIEGISVSVEEMHEAIVQEFSRAKRISPRSGATNRSRV